MRGASLSGKIATMNPSAIAHHRFGLGAQPNAEVLADPQRWLLSQFSTYEPLPAIWKAHSSTHAQLRIWNEMQRGVRQAPEGQRSGIREAYLREGSRIYQAAAGARIASALQTQTPFVERLVHFWANHFAVSVDKLLMVGFAGCFEAEAIRPHVLGRFEDMMVAVAQHPAMLLYLDQAQSVGPNSAVGARGRGLNENLAREILELHTMGVRSGYTQEDIKEFARALTGWTLPGNEGIEQSVSNFRFVPALHEPGARTILGKTYSDTGEGQARAVIRDLAASPVTARHIATKLARHFVSDSPPPALIQRLADTFLQNGGNLVSVYRELIGASEAWQPVAQKFKSPWDWLISSLRALNRGSVEASQVTSLLNQLGQPVWRPGSPAGFQDTDAAWAAPDALIRRVEIAQRLAESSDAVVDARKLGPLVLQGALSERTSRAIALAESGSSAIALLLVSPEFLRR